MLQLGPRVLICGTGKVTCSLSCEEHRDGHAGDKWKSLGVVTAQSRPCCGPASTVPICKLGTPLPHPGLGRLRWQAGCTASLQDQAPGAVPTLG